MLWFLVTLQDNHESYDPSCDSDCCGSLLDFSCDVISQLFQLKKEEKTNFIRIIYVFACTFLITNKSDCFAQKMNTSKSFLAPH